MLADLAYRADMPLLVLLSLALLVWSAVADLLIGESLYTSRNLALTAALLGGWWLLRGRSWTVTWRELGLQRRDLGRGLRWGAIAFLTVAVALLVGVFLAPYLPPIAALLADERAATFADDLWFVAIVRIPLGTAVFEEVAFRGVLLAAAFRVLSLRAAVVWTSVVFGLWHIPPTMVALWINDVSAASPGGLGTIAGAVAVTTVAGALFTWLRVASRSLVAPILAHVATNSLALIAAIWVQHGA